MAARGDRRPEFRDAPYRVVFCHIPLRWIDETPADYDAGGYDWFSRMSRDAWHDALVELGCPDRRVGAHPRDGLAAADGRVSLRPAGRRRPRRGCRIR